MNQTLLIVDDDPDSILTLSKALSLKLSGIKIQAAGNAGKALEIARELRPQVVVCDLALDPTKGIESGFELLSALLVNDATCRIIMLTGHSDKANGIRALELGATTFLAKPADLELLSALCKDAFNQAELRRELSKLKQTEFEQVLSNFLGVSEASNRVRDSIRLAAASNQPVLITGETGTGKGLCAQLIHRLSNRANKKFVRYQPNFTSAEMVSSDLFGHIKGAFTGAENNRSGLLQDASDGTLFLDEIDELPIQTQVSLLGTLQDKTFRPLGSNSDLTSNFRLICACNKPIEESLKKGALREDFYHRVAHFKIHLPALKERKTDIALLAHSFLKAVTEREQLAVFDLNPSAIDQLQSYKWPGNIRELQARIEGGAFRAVFNGRTEILSEDLELTQSADTSTPADSTSELDYVSNVRNYKKALITDALRKTNNNQMQAARLLGINRSTLSRLMTEVD